MSIGSNEQSQEEAFNEAAEEFSKILVEVAPSSGIEASEGIVELLILSFKMGARYGYYYRQPEDPKVSHCPNDPDESK